MSRRLFQSRLARRPVTGQGGRVRRARPACGAAPERAAIALIGLAALGILLSGCVRRRLTIRTNPPGAQVFVDDQEVGTTPCSASFVYYGTRTVTVMKDGYRTEKIFQKLNPPWYEIPPLDFINENLNPFETRDERIVDVQLVPEEIVPQQKLLDRAQMLRESARVGAVTPLTAAALDAPRPLEPLSLPGQGLPGGQPLPYEPLPPPSAAPPPLSR